MVHDREHEHVIDLYGVKHAVWKRMRQAAPHSAFKLTPSVRSLKDPLNRAFNLD